MVGDTHDTTVVPLASTLLTHPTLSHSLSSTAPHEREGFLSQLSWLTLVVHVMRWWTGREEPVLWEFGKGGIIFLTWCDREGRLGAKNSAITRVGGSEQERKPPGLGQNKHQSTNERSVGGRTVMPTIVGEEVSHSILRICHPLIHRHSSSIHLISFQQ